MILRTVRQFAAAIGLATVRLARTPRRTVLVVLGVALAVLAVTLLASVGYGVLATGDQKFEESDRDLWVTGGPIELEPETETPIANSLVNSHEVAEEIQARENVSVATPIAFQAMYIGTEPSDLEVHTGAGVPKADEETMVEIQEGQGLAQERVHYADGTYDGPMTREVLLDPQTATRLDVSVGEQIHVGASRADAANQTFTVVGISPTFSEFLGTEAAILYLSELQELTDTTGADRASYITISLTAEADSEAVQADLQEEYPELTVRTNREQLKTMITDQMLLIGSAGALVALAVLTGLALTVNLQLLTVAQQRRELSALRASGLSPRVLASIVGIEGFLVSVLGGLVGLAMTPIASTLLNDLVAQLVGFDTLLQTPTVVYLVGAGIAVGMGTITAGIAGWYLARSTAVSPAVLR